MPLAPYWYQGWGSRQYQIQVMVCFGAKPVALSEGGRGDTSLARETSVAVRFRGAVLEVLEPCAPACGNYLGLCPYAGA